MFIVNVNIGFSLNNPVHFRALYPAFFWQPNDYMTYPHGFMTMQLEDQSLCGRHWSGNMCTLISRLSIDAKRQAFFSCLLLSGFGCSGPTNTSWARKKERKKERSSVGARHCFHGPPMSLSHRTSNRGFSAPVPRDHGCDDQ